MGSRRPWLPLSAMLFAAACAADPGDSPKDDASAGASSDAGSGSASSGSSSGGLSSDATGALPPGDDATDATVPTPADDTSTPLVEASAPPPPPPSCTTCPLTVEYFSRAAPDHSSVAFDVAISNNGAMPQALSDLTLRYWFTADGITSFTAHMYYANLSTITTSTIAEGFTSLNASSTPPATAMADTYMEVSFTAGAGSIGAMSSTNDIQLEFNDSTYNGTQTASNDYSYTATDLMTNCDQNNVLTCQSMTITLYRDGILAWGNEPGGAQAPMADGGSEADADQ